MPKISVIIPVYNLEKYIYECLESLRNQTFNDFEAIIINDGSTDKSLEIIQRFIDIDSRFRCITIVNSGQLLARKVGLELSEGKYLSFLDGDDFVSKEWLKTLFLNIEKENADISIIGYDLYFEDNNSYIKMSDTHNRFVVKGKEVLSEWISARTFEGVLWDKLFRKELFNNLEMTRSTNYMEDILIINQFIENVKVLTYSGKPLYHYRQRMTSTVHESFKLTDFEAVDIIHDMVDLAEDDGDLRNLAYTRLAKTILSIFRKMNKTDIKNNKNKILSLLTCMQESKKNNHIKFDSMINNLILDGMLITKRVYFLSRLQAFLISLKYYFRKNIFKITVGLRGERDARVY